MGTQFENWIPFWKRRKSTTGTGGVRPVDPVPDPPPEEEWTQDREQVGNCRTCGAPIYEEFESRGMFTRHFKPPRLTWTCDCRKPPAKPAETPARISLGKLEDLLVQHILLERPWVTLTHDRVIEIIRFVFSTAPEPKLNTRQREVLGMALTRLRHARDAAEQYGGTYYADREYRSAIEQLELELKRD